MVNGLSDSAACGILPDEGSKPCLLLWQADSLPLSHQGSPIYFLKSSIMHSNFRCESTRLECKCFLFNFMISSQNIVFQDFLSQLLSSLPPSVWLIHLGLFITVFIPSLKKIMYYLFIWLHWVSVVAHGIFDIHCGMQTLSCSMWELVPQPGIESR